MVLVSVNASPTLNAERYYVEVNVSERVTASGSAMEIYRQRERREECVIGFWTGHGRAIETPYLAEEETT